MNIILNTNELGYSSFLDTSIDVFVIGLKNFCVNQKFFLSINKLKTAITEIKQHNKKIYLSVNAFALENQLNKFKKIFNKLIELDIDGFIVSDLGILNIFKTNNLSNKVILDLQTYVTNKYSAKSLLDLGIKHLSVSKEITLEDIKEISMYNNGNIEILCQGYIPITYSKRPILKCYFKNHNLKINNKNYYIKEENRENHYYISEESDALIVYNDKQYSLFSYLPELIESNVTNFKIDANFLNEHEIKEYISYYKQAIDLISKKELSSFNELKEQFNKNYDYSTPFIHNESFLLKEGN